MRGSRPRLRAGTEGKSSCAPPPSPASPHRWPSRRFRYRHHLQGSQGRRGHPRRPGRDLRHRRARPPGPAVRPDLRRRNRRDRRDRGETAAREGPRRGPRDQHGHQRPGRGDREARRRGRRRRAGRQPEGPGAGARLPAPRRPPGPGVAAHRPAASTRSTTPSRTCWPAGSPPGSCWCHDPAGGGRHGGHHRRSLTAAAAGDHSRRPRRSQSRWFSPSSRVASTAAWVRRSSPSLASRWDT